MATDNDDWDIQEAYEIDPKKALFLLSSNILQPDKLASNVVKAIQTQSDLQDALKSLHIKQVSKDPDIRLAMFSLIAEERKLFWSNLLINKKAIFFIIAFVITAFGWVNKSETTALIQKILIAKS